MDTKPAIPLTPVESSQIAAVGHAGDVLAVRFKGGQLYHYTGVSAEQHQALVGAESIGKHFNANFRGMAFERIREGESS